MTSGNKMDKLLLAKTGWYFRIYGGEIKKARSVWLAGDFKLQIA
jgi:hypothetical protein